MLTTKYQYPISYIMGYTCSIENSNCDPLKYKRGILFLFINMNWKIHRLSDCVCHIPLWKNHGGGGGGGGGGPEEGGGMGSRPPPPIHTH